MSINTEQLRKLERLAARCNDFLDEIGSDPDIDQHNLEQGKKDIKSGLRWLCRSITEHEFIDE